MKNEAIFSVIVGDVEVNDFYLPKQDATTLAKQYVADGYDDVYLYNKTNGVYTKI